MPKDFKIQQQRDLHIFLLLRFAEHCHHIIIMSIIVIFLLLYGNVNQDTRVNVL